MSDCKSRLVKCDVAHTFRRLLQATVEDWKVHAQSHQEVNKCVQKQKTHEAENSTFEKRKSAPVANMGFQKWKRQTLGFANPCLPEILILKNTNPGLRRKTVLKNEKHEIQKLFFLKHGNCTFSKAENSVHSAIALLKDANPALPGLQLGASLRVFEKNGP